MIVTAQNSKEDTEGRWGGVGAVRPAPSGENTKIAEVHNITV